jgi:hypothetical protein
LLISLFCLLT